MTSVKNHPVSQPQFVEAAMKQEGRIERRGGGGGGGGGGGRKEGQCEGKQWRERVCT